MEQARRRRPGELFVRRPRLPPIRIPIAVRPPVRLKLPTIFILAYRFAALIGVGILLLSLPISNREGGFTPFMTAFFTATSAVTTTGLAPVDMAAFWSPFGKFVVLLLVQVGGLGFMTVATLIFIFLGQRIGLRERLALRDATGAIAIGGIVRLMKQVGLLVLGVEAIGFVILAIRFSLDFPVPLSLWYALFHAVSAFNNAGFAVLPGDGLGAYRNDPVVLLTLAGLFILGGLSIVVLRDVVRWRSFGKLSLDSKLVVSVSLGLWAAGMLLFLLSEYTNSKTLGPVDIPGKLLQSFFVSSAARTAGFAILSPTNYAQGTLFFLMGLMFIGAGAGSTAGGIKVNTFGVIVSSVMATIRGRPQVEVFKREVPDYLVSRALTLGVMSLMVVLVVASLLEAAKDAPFQDMLFETVSALGTVGYSTGVTSQLGVPTLLLLAVTMFVGKIGPLTLVLVLAQKAQGRRYHYAQERVRIG